MIDTRHRALDLARGTAAAVLLLALVIGVPFLLVTAIGWPLWESVPDLSRAGDLLDRGLPDRAFLNVVACLAWFVWAQFTLSVLVEIIATIRGRATRPVPGVPSSMQSGAARLVAVALLVATVLASRGQTTAGPLPPVDQVRPDTVLVEAAPDPVRGAAVDTADAASTATATREWTVQRRDTLWGIAEQTLGSGERYDEILQLNRNRMQSDGTALRSGADRLRVGWTLQLPADAVLPDDAPATVDGVYVVQRGDSLSSIAHRTLGDRDRWPVLFEANRGRPQTDGTALDDPDVLSVGWHLQVPFGVPDHVVVREGDTLSGIADTFLGDQERWPEIFEANRGVVQPDGRVLSHPDEIDIGWTLSLPGSDAAIPEAPSPPPPPPPPPPAPEPDPVVDFTPVNLHADAPYAAPGENGTAPETGSLPDEVPPTGSTDLAADAAMATERSDDDTAAIGLPAADPGDTGGLGPAPRTPATAVGGAVAAGLLGLVSVLRARQRRRRRPDTIVPGSGDAGRRLEARLRAVADLDELTLVEWAVRSLAGSLTDVPATLSIRSVITGVGGLEVRLDRPLRTVPPGWHAEGASLMLDPAVDQDVLEAMATGPDGRWSPMPVPALLPLGTARTEPERSVFVDIEHLGVIAFDGPRDDVDDVIRGLLYAALSSPWAEECDLVVVGSFDLAEQLPWVRTASTLTEAVDLLESRARQIRDATEGDRLASPVAARLRGAGEPRRPLIVIVRSAPAHDDPLVERLAALESEGTGVAVVIGGSMPMVPNAVVNGGEVELPDGVRVLVPTLTETEHAELAALLRDATAEPVAAGTPRLVRTVDGAADAEVRILGPVEVTLGQHVIEWKENGAVDLLAWLATHPDADGSPRDVLPFDESDWTRIVTEASLRLGVDESGHRRVVDAGRGLRGATTDLARFRSLVESAASTGHATLLDDALALVRGPALGAGAHRPGWADELADQITDEVLAVVQRSADAHERLGDTGAVRGALEVGVLADPGNEAIWRRLVQAVEDDEGPDAAHACAIRMRSMIDRVAGRYERLEPETDALVERVRAASRASA